jgi:hypothetical protein
MTKYCNLAAPGAGRNWRVPPSHMEPKGAELPTTNITPGLSGLWPLSYGATGGLTPILMGRPVSFQDTDGTDWTSVSLPGKP